MFTGCLLVVGQATMLKLTALSAPPCCNSSNMLSCPLQPLLTASVFITAQGWTALKCLAESKPLWLILLQNSWWNMSHHKTLDATQNSLNIFHLQTEPKTTSCSVQRAEQDPETAFWHVYQLTWSGQTRRKARANPLVDSSGYLSTVFDSQNDQLVTTMLAYNLLAHRSSFSNTTVAVNHIVVPPPKVNLLT